MKWNVTILVELQGNVLPLLPSGWEFGLLNMGLLVLVGATISYQFGLFDPELIPGFVLSQEELWSQW